MLLIRIPLVNKVHNGSINGFHFIWLHIIAIFLCVNSIILQRKMLDLRYNVDSQSGIHDVKYFNRVDENKDMDKEDKEVIRILRYIRISMYYKRLRMRHDNL